MRILYVFVLFVFWALFSYNCSPKSGSVNTIAPSPDQTSIDINIEYLCQHWVHSREEQQETDEDQIYRPKGFKEFPASRFRMQYIFYKNGNCEWFYLAPDDGHHFKSGQWRVDANDKNNLQVVKDGGTESYRVTELKKDMLRIARIKPNG